MNGYQESSDQRFISRLREVILKNISDENFGVSELARETGLSRYHIYKRVRAINGQNVVRFIREIRLDEAMTLLKQDAGMASEIAYMVGFGSPAYFNKCFHDHFGFTPGEARKRSAHNTEITEPGPEGIGGNETATGVFSDLGHSGFFLKKKYMILVSLVGIVLSVLMLWVILRSSENNNRSASLIVMPFSNYTSDLQYEFFAEGVTESVIKNLLEIENLNVISGNESAALKSKPYNIIRLLQNGVADYVLEGSVQKNGPRVRINVRLTEGRKTRVKWSDNYDREFEDIFKIQSDIARNVADQLDLILSDEETSSMDKRSSVSTEAYIYYLKGRYFLNKSTKPDSEKSLEYFRRAIDLDPDYALAYAGLADALLDIGYRSWDDAGYEEAIAAARKAIELNNNLSEAHAAMGSLLCWYERKWAESREELLLAIELNPKNEWAHYRYSRLMDLLGNNEMARKHINIALTLNPFTNSANYYSILYYMNEGKYDESLKEIQRLSDLVEVRRQYYYSYLNHLLLGNDELFVQNLSLYFSVDPTRSDFARVVKEIYASDGRDGVLRWLVQLESSKEMPRYYLLAYFHVCLGENAAAIDCLGKAYNINTLELPQMNNDPFFRPLRSEPEFKEIIKKLGL